MSRSRRKTPKLGITTAESEKAEKVAAHRRSRHTAKSAVKVTARKDEDGAGAEREHARSGQWQFAKDGKRWIGPGISEGRRWRTPSRRLMQK